MEEYPNLGREQQSQELLTEEQLGKRREDLRSYMSQRWMQMTSEERERLRERRRNTDRLRRLRMTEEQLERRREQRRNYMRRRRNIALGLVEDVNHGRQLQIKYENPHVEETNILRVQGRTRLNRVRQQARMGTTQVVETVQDDIQATNINISGQAPVEEMKHHKVNDEIHEIFRSKTRIRLSEVKRIARLIGKQRAEKMDNLKVETVNDVQQEDLDHDEGIDEGNVILQNRRRSRLTEIRRQARLLNDAPEEQVHDIDISIVNVM